MSHMSTQLNQLTLRGLDSRLRREIRALAQREGISLNKAALRLLEKGAGIGPDSHLDQIGSSLDHLIATWTDEQAHAFLDSIKACEEVDAELWK